MNFADKLAVYAAVVSTLSVGWNIYNGWRDRYRLRATSYYRNEVADDEEGYAGTIYYHVVNHGRRPITIKRVMAKNLTGSMQRFSEDLNYRLEEGQDVDFTLAWDGDQARYEMPLIFFVEDATGRRQETKRLHL